VRQLRFRFVTHVAVTPVARVMPALQQSTQHSTTKFIGSHTPQSLQDLSGVVWCGIWKWCQQLPNRSLQEWDRSSAGSAAASFRAMVHWRLMINMTDLVQQLNFALEIQCFHHMRLSHTRKQAMHTLVADVIKLTVCAIFVVLHCRCVGGTVL